MHAVMQESLHYKRITLNTIQLTWRTLYINKLAMMPPAHQQRCSLLSVVIFASTVGVIALLPLRCIIGRMKQADPDAPRPNPDAAFTPLYLHTARMTEPFSRLAILPPLLIPLPTRPPSGLLNGRGAPPGQQKVKASR